MSARSEGTLDSLDLHQLESKVVEIRAFVNATYEEAKARIEDADGNPAGYAANFANPLYYLGEMDYWDAKRSKAERSYWKITSLLSDVRDEYHDKMRSQMKRGLVGRQAGMAYEERKMVYESNALDEYRKVAQLEKAQESLRLLVETLKYRVSWLDRVRREYVRLEDAQRYTTNKDFRSQE